MKIFISGGCKNGKSSYAQDIAVKLANGSPLYYIATMIPYDNEDRLRIKKHIENREGMGFQTIEIGTNLTSHIATLDKNATYLLDSVTALLQNEMFQPKFDCLDPDAVERTKKSLLHFIHSVKNVVIVSDYIYSDATHFEQTTETYRAGLATIDKVLAKQCEVVIEVCAGNIIFHKGALI